MQISTIAGQCQRSSFNRLHGVTLNMQIGQSRKESSNRVVAYTIQQLPLKSISGITAQTYLVSRCDDVGAPLLPSFVNLYSPVPHVPCSPALLTILVCVKERGRERWRELDRVRESERGRGGGGVGSGEKCVCGHSCPPSDGERERERESGSHRGVTK